MTYYCKTCIAKYWKQWSRTENGKVVNKASILRYKYGIDLPDYERMRDEQGGVCAICKQNPQIRHPKGMIKALDVDHNHETGKVRGLLCMYCNRGLGYLPSPEHLLAAAEYLTQRGWYVKPRK